MTEVWTIIALEETTGVEVKQEESLGKKLVLFLTY